MNKKQKKILLLESIILIITLPIAIAGWYKFFKLAHEFIAYEQKQQLAYTEEDLDENLKKRIEEYKEGNQGKDTEDDKKEEIVIPTGLIETLDVEELFRQIDSEEYLIVTFAQEWCGHCKAFKPTATEFAKEIEYKYYWVELNLLDKEDKDAILNRFSELKGTPYTAITSYGKLVGSVEGEASLGNLIERINEVTK